ncbi:MAG: DUF1579 family protein [Fimbriimonadaceae bacterium]
MKKLALLFAIVCSSFSFAQQVKPVAEIQELKWMVGTWTSAGDYSMMGDKFAYTAEWTVSMEGPFLKMVNKTHFEGIETSETAYLYFDSGKKEYVMTTYTDFATTPRTARGTIVDGALVVTGEPWEVVGTMVVGRSTFKKVSDDQISMKLEMKSETGWDVATNDPLKRKKG